MKKTYRVETVHTGIGIIVTPLLRFTKINCPRCSKPFRVGDAITEDLDIVLHVECP